VGRLSKLKLKFRKHRKLIACIIIGAILTTPIVGLTYYYTYIQTSNFNSLNLNFDTNYDSINSSNWVTPSFQDEDFVFEIESYTPGSSLWQNVTYSVEYYDMGTTDHFKSNSTEWGEWGYSFNHITDGAIDGAGVPQNGGYPTPPKNKQEAYTYMREYIVNRTINKNNNTRPWISFNGHYPFHHYAAEFGFDKIGTEIGENMESYQMLMAFNRGAARQYQLPWFTDVSAWYGGGITDHNIPSTWSETGGENKGHSMSLYRRSYFMSYMAGTSRLIAEGGLGNIFYRHHGIDENGLMLLTPLGEIAREVSHFAQNHSNRGIAYNPIGLYIDEYHGTIGFDSTNRKSFNAIPYTKGDEMTYKILDFIYPGGWKDNKENCQLVNNEFGDLFDIILQNASTNTLASYPVILMSGDIHQDAVEKSRLIDYVDNGGTLIVNSAYFSALNQELENRKSSLTLDLDWLETPKFLTYKGSSNSTGGNFILYGEDYNPSYLRSILKELLPKITPFNLFSSGPIGSDQGPIGAKVHIQSMINRNENGWVLTLINNDGISKEFFEPPIVKENQLKEVTITMSQEFLNTQMKGQSVVQVNDWINNIIIWKNSSNQGNFQKITVSIPPGDIQVIEFVF
jgi:hypothetical protein